LQDLLRKANGNEALARRWLQRICEDEEGPSGLIPAASELLFLCERDEGVLMLPTNCIRVLGSRI
jgi:hypothetical protein